MHEFSLAQGLFDQLMDLARKHSVKKILRIEVLVGENSGIVEESFLFGFNVLSGQNDITRELKLDVVHDESDDLILQKVELEE